MCVSERLRFVDYTKAIGIILVVFGHVFRGLKFEVVVPNYSLYVTLDSVIYTFHMPLFFFVSGMFFYDSFRKRGFWSFIKTKVDTIVYPYIVWRFIQGLPMVVIGMYGLGHHNISYEILFQFWKPIAQFWFLYDLFLMFLLSALIFQFIDKKYALAVGLVAVILYFFQSEISQSGIPIVPSIAKNYIYFLLGVVFVDKIVALGKPNLLLLAAVMSVFCLCQYYFHVGMRLDWESKGLSTLILGFLGIALTVLFSAKIASFYSRTLTLIGNSSLAIYLMHVLFCAALRLFLQKVLHIEDFYFHMILGLIVGLLFPILVLKFADRVNFPYLIYYPVSRLKLFAK